MSQLAQVIPVLGVVLLGIMLWGASGRPAPIPVPVRVKKPRR